MLFRSLVAVMTPVVVLVNGITRGDWWQAVLFGLAVAVGLTPEMLPMIIAVCLSRGALVMADRKVIVKHVDSIENLGAMDILCTDKTGTLTQDRIILQRHCDVALREDAAVLRLAWLNSHFQTGLKNLLDRAILDHAEMHAAGIPAGAAKLDEIPFDFSRRMMSVVVAEPDGRRRLICKGAPDAAFARTFFSSVSRRLFGTVGVDADIEFAAVDLDPLEGAGGNAETRRYANRGDLAMLIEDLLDDLPLRCP